MHAGIVTRDLPTNGDGLFLMNFIIRADLGNGTGNEANGYAIYVDQSGGTAQPRIRLQTGFDGANDSYADLPPGTNLADTHFWILEIDVVGEVSPVVTQRAYMDGVLVHTGTQTHDVSQVFRYDNALNTYLFLDRATNFDYGPIWVKFSPLTTGLLDAYKLAYDRNFSTYTPPEYCNV